ncbi:MAG: hypothetical protein HQK99_17295 [Nitrospirae bacterium]|nr:hypothetical protein [Nitrospirota bacterium]
MPATLPVEIYDLLEKKVGKEEAREVGRVILASFDAIESRAETVVIQKKAEIKEELTKELTTKEDLAKLEGKLNSVEGRLSERITNVEGKLNERISSLEGRMNEKFAALEGRMNEKFADLEGRMNEKFADLEGRMNEKFAALEGRMNERFTTMDWKMRVYFLILLFTILLTNPKALDLIARLFGLVK